MKFTFSFEIARSQQPKKPVISKTPIQELINTDGIEFAVPRPPAKVTKITVASTPSRVKRVPVRRMITLAEMKKLEQKSVKR